MPRKAGTTTKQQRAAVEAAIREQEWFSIFEKVGTTTRIEKFVSVCG